MTEYIVHKRFKTKAICGNVNLPAKTVCMERGGIIYYGDNPLCTVNSEGAYKHFARNNDGRGLERGRLTSAITAALTKRDDQYQERWDKVWNDPVCRPFKRIEFDDHWLWNLAFFNAEIFSLKHIANLVGCK